MKLAILHPFLCRYARGIEHYVVSLSSALAAAGADVTLLTWRWPLPVRIGRLDKRVRVRQMADSRYYRAQLAGIWYAWQLSRERYDQIIVHWADYGEAMAIRLADRVRRQRVTAVMHYPLDLARWRYEAFRRSGLDRRADEIVSVSRFVADGVLRAWGRSSAVIGHGVDRAHFRPDPAQRLALRCRLGLPAAAQVLVSVAALEWRKGVQRVVAALPELPQLHYLVAGEGPDRRRIEATVAASSAGERVHLLGAQEDVAPLLQASDAFVLLAEGEASSLATLEAIACGLPVLVADVPPFDELVAPAQRVSLHDPALLPAALGALLRSAAPSSAGLRSWDAIARQYLELWGR
jgi:glycosyltransferase involved in cell wall biosynthesis